jgi:hypothetical protein
MLMMYITVVDLCSFGLLKCAVFIDSGIPMLFFLFPIKPLALVIRLKKYNVCMQFICLCIYIMFSFLLLSLISDSLGMLLYAIPRYSFGHRFTDSDCLFGIFKLVCATSVFSNVYSSINANYINKT